MKKMQSLFKRTFKGHTVTVHNEILPGAEWVQDGEGYPTMKMDGTCCKIDDNVLFKRYDRKLKKEVTKKNKGNKLFYPFLSDFKTPPDGWEPCEKSFDPYTFHWPGWLEIDRSLPENQYHVDAFDYCVAYGKSLTPAILGEYKNGTYELVGPKIQGNPHNLSVHMLLLHGHYTLHDVPTDFKGLNRYLKFHCIEGIVWHHKSDDGRMVKIKRSDFGYKWPDN